MIARYRKRRKFYFVLLLVCVCMMSVGFAAFSTTLNISSSASVSPNSDDFKLMFCDNVSVSLCNDSFIMLDPYFVSDGADYDVSAGFDFNAVYDLGGSFTAPNQKVVYKMYIHNVGEYDAYLRGITFTPLDNGSYKKCSATTSDSTKATDSLVQAACNGITTKIVIDGKIYDIGDNISGHKLSKGTSEYIEFTVEYGSGTQLADGPFNVEFGTLKVNYSSVDNPVSLITFTIDGVEYQTYEGMTWEEWLNSEENTSGLTSINRLRTSTNPTCLTSSSLLIISGEEYLTGACFVPDPSYKDGPSLIE